MNKRTASEIELSYPTTPKKSRTAGQDQGDRFIPSRSGMDIDVANFNIMSTSKENSHPNYLASPVLLQSPAKVEYASTLADNLFEGGCNAIKSSKVLAFKHKAP